MILRVCHVPSRQHKRSQISKYPRTPCCNRSLSWASCSTILKLVQHRLFAMRMVHAELFTSNILRAALCCCRQALARQLCTTDNGNNVHRLKRSCKTDWSRSSFLCLCCVQEGIQEKRCEGTIKKLYRRAGDNNMYHTHVQPVPGPVCKLYQELCRTIFRFWQVCSCCCATPGSGLHRVGTAACVW